MKKSIHFILFAAIPLTFSCGQGTEKQSSAKTTDTVVAKECFIAIDGVDTGKMQLETTAKGKVTGKLVIDYLDKGDSDGELLGKFKGDTLFIDYTFKVGTTNKTIYKNPLAFLRRDGKLIMGVGQIETFLGKSSFVKGKAINFERGRFTFSPDDCK